MDPWYVELFAHVKAGRHREVIMCLSGEWTGPDANSPRALVGAAASSRRGSQVMREELVKTGEKSGRDLKAHDFRETRREQPTSEGSQQQQQLMGKSRRLRNDMHRTNSRMQSARGAPSGVGNASRSLGRVRVDPNSVRLARNKHYRAERLQQALACVTGGESSARQANQGFPQQNVITRPSPSSSSASSSSPSYFARDSTNSTLKQVTARNAQLVRKRFPFDDPYALRVEHEQYKHAQELKRDALLRSRYQLSERLSSKFAIGQGLVEMYASLDVSRHISAYAKLKFHGTDSKAAALARPKAFNIERSDKDGMTLLMHACGLGDAEYPGLAMRLTRVLCEHGMDVNAKHKHYKYCTAMDFAVLKGNVGAAKVLLRFGSTCKRSYVLQILKKKHKEQSVLTVLKKHAALMALFDAGDGYTDAEDFHRAARLLDDSALRGMMADKEHSAGNLAFREPMHGGCSVLQHLVWRCAGTLAVCSVSPAAQHTYQRVLECMKTVVQQVPAQIHLDSDDRALRLHFDAHRLHRRAFEGSRGHIDAYSDPYFCGGAKSVMGTSLARRHLECAQWMLLCDVAPEPGMDGQRLQQGVVVQRWAIKLRAALTFASVQSVSHCLGQISARCDVVEAVNYRDQYGRNSLFYCAHCSNVLVAQLLIKHGVALDCVDMFGDSAMDLALFHNNTPLCVFLLEQGFQASVEDMVAKIADAHYPVQIKGVGTLLIEFMMKVITAGGPNGRAVGVDSAHETLGGMRVSFGNPKAVSLMLDDKSLRLPQAFKEYVLELIGRFLRFSERKLGQHGAKLDEHTSSSNFTAPEQELEQLTWSALSQRYMSLEEMENEQSNTFEGWSSADDGDEDGDAGISGEDKKKKKQRKRKEEGAREEVKEEEAKEEGSPLSEEGAVKARIKRELAVARARAKKRNKLLAAAMPGDADAHKEEFVDHSLIKSVPRDVEYRLVWIFDSIKLPHQTPDAVDEDEDDYVCELGDVLLFLENSKIKHDERFRNVDLGASLYSAAATEESQQLDELQTEGMDEKARSRYEWTHPRAPENRQVIMLDTWLALWNSSLELDGDEPLLNMLNYFFKKSLDKRMESQLLRFSAGAAEGMESFEEMQKQRSARSKLVREQAELTASLRGIQVSESMRGGIPKGAQTY